MFLQIFHLSVFLINSFTVWYDQVYVDLPFPAKELEVMPLKARGIFLTFWCLILQTVYFGIAVLNDIFGTNSPAPKKRPVIRFIKDTLFSLAFPVAIYVSTAFWGIYVFDKDLIFPEYISKVFPVWMNHTMHTLIVPFIFLELILSARKYPSRKLGVFITLCFCGGYTAWIFFLRANTGVWVYPFMAYLSVPARLAFTSASIFSSVCVYWIGEKIDQLVCGNKTSVYVNGDMKKH